MTKQEAMNAMREGKKVTHRYFSNNEWATAIPNGKVLTEDGCRSNWAEWWLYRTGDGFANDWSIYKE